MRKAGKVAAAILAVVSMVTIVYVVVISILSHNFHCDDDFEYDLDDFEPWLDEDIED